MVNSLRLQLLRNTVKQLAFALFVTAALAGCSGGGDSENGVVLSGIGNSPAETDITLPDNGPGAGNTDQNNTQDSSSDNAVPADNGSSGNNSSSADNNASNGSNDNSPDNSAASGNAVSTGPTVTSLRTTHRSGQTFVVWNEMDGQTDYHVYRHNAPITAGNIGSATRLTEKWGPLGQDTSVNIFGNGTAPRNFVISDLGSPLSDNNGMFVYTTQNGEQGNAYYAVTSVQGGSENRNIVAGSNATTQAVNEFISTPRPVLTVSTNGGKGRIYTQFMDYANWNPTLNGYVFNFAVALPGNYNPSQSYPLMLELHAFGESHKFEPQAEFNWPFIQLFAYDPGVTVNTTHTWWYGHAADHNYATEGSIPRSGVVENFTEQRVLAAVDFVIDDGQFNVDDDLVHIIGNSMGASGALTYGIRYPSVFAGIYASQPMTNYRTDPVFQENFRRIWGEQSRNLPIMNNGVNNSAIRNFSQGQSQATQVWDWMNHFEQIQRRSGDRFAYLMIDHGKADGTIDWATQGRPVAQALTDARMGFSSQALEGVGHSWMGFGAIVRNVFGLGFGDLEAWRYPKSLSFPSIRFASGSGSLQPGLNGDDRQNITIEWATPRNNFHQSIVDSANRYEITIRSTAGTQTAQITPRNTNSFRPSAGTSCSWTARSNNDNRTIGSGTATVDGSRLITIPNVSIVTGSGTRLSINC